VDPIKTIDTTTEGTSPTLRSRRSGASAGTIRCIDRTPAEAPGPRTNAIPFPERTKDRLGGTVRSAWARRAACPRLAKDSSGVLCRHADHDSHLGATTHRLGSKSDRREELLILPRHASRPSSRSPRRPHRDGFRPLGAIPKDRLRFRPALRDVRPVGAIPRDRLRVWTGALTPRFRSARSRRIGSASARRSCSPPRGPASLHGSTIRLYPSPRRVSVC